MSNCDDVRFRQVTDCAGESPTLIEGLPGNGQVASIAVDLVTEQLELDQYGSIRSHRFPQVTTFADGRVQDTVRVHAGSDPDVMTLRSDVPIPEEVLGDVSTCVFDAVADDLERAIFIAGAPAETHDQRGEVAAVTTTDDLASELESSGVALAQRPGAVGGVTGALVNGSFQQGIPTALLLVRVDPNLPDPGAAKSVIENALEPLVDFDIDTASLQKQADAIEEKKRQLAQQLRDEQEEPRQAKDMFY